MLRDSKERVVKVLGVIIQMAAASDAYLVWKHTA